MIFIDYYFKSSIGSLIKTLKEKLWIRLAAMSEVYEEQPLLNAIRSLIEDTRLAEIQTGPACMQPAQLPPKDADIITIIKWMDRYFLETRSTVISNSKLKNITFGKKTEKVLKEANKAEKKTEKLKVKKTITRKERDAAVENLKTLIDRIEKS